MYGKWENLNGGVIGGWWLMNIHFILWLLLNLFLEMKNIFIISKCSLKVGIISCHINWYLKECFPINSGKVTVQNLTIRESILQPIKSINHSGCSFDASSVEFGKKILVWKKLKKKRKEIKKRNIAYAKTWVYCQNCKSITATQ